ncbi:WxL domain-containing protein [Enterococcus hirae]
MKKNVLLTVASCVPLLLGSAGVFADTTPTNTTNSSTPVSANFTVSSVDPSNPNPPSPVDPSHPDQGGNTNLNPNSTFALAYLPSKFDFGTIDLTGKSSLNVQATTNGKTFNIGVKNTTHNQNAWNLTAKLTGNLVDYGATINTANNVAQLNNNGNLTALTDTGAITVSNTVNIGGSAINMMSGNAQHTFAGTYDLKLGSVSLNIPDTSKVVSGNTSGSITWNLEKVPTSGN